MRQRTVCGGVEGLEARRMFAAVVVEVGALRDLVAAADTDGNGSLSAVEAKGYVNVIKGQLKTALTEYNAGVKQLKADFAASVRDLNAETREQLSSAESGEERSEIKSSQREQLSQLKSELKDQLATAKESYNESISVTKPAQTIFTSFSKMLLKPFVGDANGDRQLSSAELDTLAVRDGVAGSVSVKDFAKVNVVRR